MNHGFSDTQGAPLNDQKCFELMVSGVSDYAIYMLDTQGVVSSWNSGAQRFTGYRSDEIVGQHSSILYTEEDRAANLPMESLQTALSDEEFRFESWRIRKDGTRFLASVSIQPIRDDSNKLIGFSEVTRDITEQKEAQDAQRGSEENFRLLVQGVTDYAIFMISPTGIVTNWNSGAQRIKGYSYDEIVGTHFSRFYTEEDRSNGVPAQALATAASVGRYEKEGRRVRKDGSTFWANVVIDAIRDDQGDLMGFAKVTRDITEKIQAQEALAQANRALFQAQKMEAIGQLTGGIAHDFNNLLAVVSGGLDMLSIRPQDAHNIKILEGMRRGVQRGATLTQQLLSFARKQPLRTEKHDLNAVIENFFAVLQRAGNSLIVLEVNLSPMLKAILVDAAGFEAALLNLVVNARDAMPNGGKLAIATSMVERGEWLVDGPAACAYVKVCVSDTGMGMTPEIAARAIEPFFTTKEIGKGTGLGLSQVYGFIKQSGGEVLIESEVGKGTLVSVFLPAMEEAADPSETDTQKESVRNADTVLIVEDEPDLLEMASELFRSIGYDVVTASDGHAAIDILQLRPDIDILFTDVMMPNGMTGVELARSTRALAPHIKIIIVSGYPLPALKAAHGDLDDFSFLSKPYRLSELAKKLRAPAN